jgi:hypothetical protein
VVERQVLDDEQVVDRSPDVACESVVLEPYAGVGVPVVSWYIGRGKREGNFTLWMLWPKARGPRWFGDQLRSQSSSLSWRCPCPRFSWWREQLSRLLSTLRARRWASMVFRASRLGPRRLLTADAAALAPSPHSRCREGGGFGPWANDALARPRSERWREAELSACCAAAASSSAFSYWRTRRSSEVTGSGQPCSNMAAAARF